MNTELKNPLAFPQWDGHAITSEPQYLRGGMTLRDYFAAAAMQAMCAGPGARMVADRDRRYDEKKGNWAEIVADNAYNFADAMLAARSRK